jgi:hypothetical protein
VAINVPISMGDSLDPVWHDLYPELLVDDVKIGDVVLGFAVTGVKRAEHNGRRAVQLTLSHADGTAQDRANAPEYGRLVVLAGLTLQYVKRYTPVECGECGVEPVERVGDHCDECARDVFDRPVEQEPGYRQAYEQALAETEDRLCDWLLNQGQRRDTPCGRPVHAVYVMHDGVHRNICETHVHEADQAGWTRI